ncbi:hypothetical protein [Ancrocorticia populi]|uniref:hypothetical protein n=1 Tax=Ancrocorticia populi TaxID=2175228 RepID=UPI001FAFCDE6|nr:hypothetical protein [Ancrocorticia populi]
MTESNLARKAAAAMNPSAWIDPAKGQDRAEATRAVTELLAPPASPAAPANQMVDQVQDDVKAQTLIRETALADLNEMIQNDAAENAFEFWMTFTAAHPQAFPLLTTVFQQWTHLFPASMDRYLPGGRGISPQWERLPLEWEEWLPELPVDEETLNAWQADPSLVVPALQWEGRHMTLRITELLQEAATTIILNRMARLHTGADDLWPRRLDYQLAKADVTLQELTVEPTTHEAPLAHLAWTVATQDPDWLDQTMMDLIDAMPQEWPVGELPAPQWMIQWCQEHQEQTNRFSLNNEIETLNSEYRLAH